MTEISSKDKEEMFNFCYGFKGNANETIDESVGKKTNETIDERDYISVPLESLPSCFHKLFSDKNFQILSDYFGLSPAVVGVQIVRDPPHVQQQNTHASITIGTRLSSTFEIVFEGCVTTWLIPGSQKLLQRESTILIQPCIPQSKCAMVYDSRILHCYAGNNKKVDSFRMLIKFEAMLATETKDWFEERYYLPGERITSKEVLQHIKKELGQNTTVLYDFKALQQGEIIHVQQFSASVFGSDGSDVEAGIDFEAGSDDDDKTDAGGVMVCLCFCVSLVLIVTMIYLFIGQRRRRGIKNREPC
jgi:hypothetical protein